MTATAFNVHATAIVLGTRGLLFVGPSGSGKSMLALACLASADRLGLFCALISDDQVMLLQSNGQVIARAPAAIAGLAEVRGAGIVSVRTIAAAVIDCAISPLAAPHLPRMPPEGERYTLNATIDVPLFRLPYGNGIDAFEMLRRILPETARF